MSKTKINKKDIQKWIDALRSGKYRQTIGGLQDEDGYCCLGVACKVFVPDVLLEKTRNNFISGLFPAAQPHAPAWLKDINDDFLNKTGESLSVLNDGTGPSLRLTFDEIADLLQAVYIQEVL